MRRLAIVALLLAALPMVARAHAVVFPRTSTPGAYERYVLRVPNERDAATTRIEIRFPGGARVLSFEDVPGWTLSIVRDSAQRIVGAVWTGILQPERFVELPFIAVNPREAGRLDWPAFQTYANGERVEWTGAEESERPASFTTIAAGPASATSWLPLWLAIAALLVAILAWVRPAARRA